MITYALAAKLFESFSILRWNDRLRPIELLETDHHALKSMLTYFLGKQLETSGTTVDWRKVVDVNVLDLLSKISTSDIQSTVRRALKKEDAFKQLIIRDWNKPSLKLNDIVRTALNEYVNGGETTSVEYKILRFSHKYITFREFEIIKASSSQNDDIKEIEHKLKKELDDATHENFGNDADDLITEKSQIAKIMEIAGRLRYQTRWSQTPRIPQTSVLGHSMYCAVLAYFFSIEAELDSDRIVNNFYAALFHDLPEALSRDIISPVKKADPAISKLIEKEEKRLCEKEIFSKTPETWSSHFRFITGQMCPKEDKLNDNQLDDEIDKNLQRKEFNEHAEFSNRILKDSGKYLIVKWGKDNKTPYKEPMDNYKSEAGIDGKLLKVCDNLAAFMEARMSLQHGIRSPHLDNGLSNALSACQGRKIYNLVVDDFFESITF